MALRQTFSLINSEFNEFLFASLGEDGNGTEITVLSALTRLGTDPWLEAARLSDLPRETAARMLAATIARLPEGDWKVADTSAIAARLVNRLPRRGARAAKSPQGESSRDKTAKSKAAIGLVCIVLFAAVLFGVSYFHPDHPSEPNPSAVSSMPQ